MILCQISNMFVSSFSLSPRSQELLVSDLWFIYLNFEQMISLHFTQIEDRKSAGALNFGFLLSLF